MLSILLPYLILLFVAFLLQRKMIYFPETYPLQQLSEVSKNLNLQPWPSKEEYRGLISRNDMVDSKGTILVFHGNAGSASGRTFYIDALEKLGYQVILAEYPGYGSRSGRPSQQVLIEDALETTRLAQEQFGKPLFLWGESLGGGVVSGIVREAKFDIQGIALTTPFDSLANIAQHHYPFLLGKWLTLDKFNNIDSLQNYTGNIAVLMAKQDEIIPNKNTLNLFNKLSNRKKIWKFPDAGHNTMPVSPSLPWWEEVTQFLSQHNDIEK